MELIFFKISNFYQGYAPTEQTKFDVLSFNTIINPVGMSP